MEFLEKEKLCFKVYAYEDVEKKGKSGIDDVLKIDKEIEQQQQQQMDEPTEEIPKNVKSINDNFNNNN